MGLQISIWILANESACRGQLFGGRGDRKSRRDRIKLTTALMPFRQKRFRLVVSALSGIAELGWSVTVHHHLPRDHTGAAPFAFIKKCFDRFAVYCAIYRGCRRSIAQQFVKEELRNSLRVFRVAKSLLLDERVFLQPFKKLGTVRTDDLRLREVNVGIDKSRQYKTVRVMIDLRRYG